MKKYKLEILELKNTKVEIKIHWMDLITGTKWKSKASVILEREKINENMTCQNL